MTEHEQIERRGRGGGGGGGGGEGDGGEFFLTEFKSEIFFIR